MKWLSFIIILIPLLIRGQVNPVGLTDETTSVIKTIKINSTNDKFLKISNEVVKRYKNHPYQSTNLDSIKRELYQAWSSNQYHLADIESTNYQRDGTLVIQTRNPIFFNTRLQGVSTFTLPELSEYLNLSKYNSNNPNFHYEIIQKIRFFYLEKGYAKVDVRASIEVISSTEKKILFDVTEGPRVKISTIRFIGQFSRHSDYYEKRILKLGNATLKSRYFSRQALESSIENIKSELLNSGFLKAQIQVNRISYSQDFSKADITILFYEGVQTLLKKIEFKNQTVALVPFLEKQLSLQVGKPLALNKLEEDAESLKRFYKSKGFLQVQLINFGPQMISYSADYSEALLLFEIEEGPQIIVDKIELVGLETTLPYVVHKEIDFKVGEILTNEKIKDTQERLYLTGLFRDVKIELIPEQSTEQRRQIRISLFEREPGLLNIGLGAHNERGLTTRGFLGLTYNNLFGTARVLSARLDGQYNLVNTPFFERSIQATYIEPYLLQTRIRGRVSLSRSFLITDFNNAIAAEANRTTYSIEQNLTPRLLLRWQLFEITTFRDFDIQSSQNTNRLDIGSTRIGIEWDKRDHPFSPTSGFFTQGFFEHANPSMMSSEWVRYHKTQINWSQYLTVWNDKQWVLALGGRWGYLTNGSSAEGFYQVPYDKVGFFMGGQANMRGFTLNEIFPSFKDLGGANFRLNGSAEMRLAKFELRIPIIQNIGTAIFYDLGDIRFNNHSYQSGWRTSAGLAFRYLTPLGAVSLEYAWKLPPQAARGESPSTLHFAIGTF